MSKTGKAPPVIANGPPWVRQESAADDLRLCGTVAEVLSNALRIDLMTRDCGRSMSGDEETSGKYDDRGTDIFPCVFHFELLDLWMASGNA